MGCSPGPCLIFRETAASGTKQINRGTGCSYVAIAVLRFHCKHRRGAVHLNRVKSAFEEIAKSTDTIDVLANNAGIGAVGTVEDATEDEWDRVLNINVAGIGRVSAAAMPFLRKSKSAAIVNTCSIAATAGLPKRAVYSASKGAVMSLTLAMAADAVKEKIRVNCVNPGTADTPWVARLLSQAKDPAAERQYLEARQPLGRLVSADEVANAILYLANPRQGSTTGTILAVDGGMHGLRLPK